MHRRNSDQRKLLTVRNSEKSFAAYAQIGRFSLIATRFKLQLITAYHFSLIFSLFLFVVSQAERCVKFVLRIYHHWIRGRKGDNYEKYTNMCAHIATSFHLFPIYAARRRARLGDKSQPKSTPAKPNVACFWNKTLIKRHSQEVWNAK